jgi:hypothetical protein
MMKYREKKDRGKRMKRERVRRKEDQQERK